MLTPEEIQTSLLQFTRGKMGFVASEDAVECATQPTVPQEALESLDKAGLLNFLRELPDLTREWGDPEWVGLEFGGETLFIHPRKDVWVGVWMEGGLERFSPFQAFVQERMDDLLTQIRTKLLKDFEEVLQCVRFLVARLEDRWGKILVRTVFFFSLPGQLRKLFRHPEVLSSGDLSRKDLEAALADGLRRFVTRLERAWGREPVRREILHALRAPHPDRPARCVRDRLQKFLPRL